MTVDKREQVFVSSTFKDLVEERRSVIQTLLEADCIPAGMELFPASDDQKFDLIKRVIDLCDYYVVVVGGRYGSVDDEAQLSFTELEFEYAVKQKKPVMAFLHGDPGNIVGDKLDLDPSLREKLDKFRKRLEHKMVKYWHEPRDLPGQVALAMMQIRKSHPAEGWIRAGEAMTPELKAELVELRAKVRELSAQLTITDKNSPFLFDADELVQGDDEAGLDCTISYHYRDALDKDIAYKSNRSRAPWTVHPTWGQIFMHLGPELTDEVSERRMSDSLSVLCLTMARSDLVDDDSLEVSGNVGAVYEAELTNNSFNDVKVQLMALGLIEKGTKRRLSSDVDAYWKLTSAGTTQIIHLRAARRALGVELPSINVPVPAPEPSA